jgi:hypothetical protein
MTRPLRRAHRAIWFGMPLFLFCLLWWSWQR